VKHVERKGIVGVANISMQGQRILMEVVEGKGLFQEDQDHQQYLKNCQPIFL
jgi:hypothetical protein